MTNTTDTKTTYTVALTVDNGFSAFTIGAMIADAMATMQDEPFDTNFDPFWDGTPQVILPLVYGVTGAIDRTQVGTLTITAPHAVRCFSCDEMFHTKEEMHKHARVHITTMRQIPRAIPGEPTGFICPEKDCGEVFDAEKDYWQHWGAKH